MEDLKDVKKNINAEIIVKKLIELGKRIHISVGSGFGRHIYRNELIGFMENAKLSFVSEPVVKVKYEGFQLRGKKVDFIVEEKVIVEVVCLKGLKAVEKEILNSEKISGKKYGLILNFGKTEFEYIEVKTVGSE